VIVVDVSAMALSRDPSETIRTYALGSCIGVTLYDPVHQIGGILHFQLPLPPPNLILKNIYMYGNTGIPQFINEAYELGARKEHLQICLVGGSQTKQDNDLFKIGYKNYLIAKRILAKNKFSTFAEDVGGEKPRTLSLQINNGEVSIQSQQVQKNLVGGEYFCQYNDLAAGDVI
jgi:chemotaxis protein CheD